MFRILVQGGRRAYTCNCLYHPSALTRLPSTVRGYFPNNNSSELHTSPVFSTMDKELKGKKTIIRIGQDVKLERTINDGEEEPELIGLSEAGVTIPTLATHQMLVDGVPFCELPIVHIKSSLNNTIMTATNHSGSEIIIKNSCGREGFKNVKKSTNVAAQATGLSLGLKAVKKGVTSVRVIVRGIGAGRMASIKGLQMAGLKIVSITDDTPIPFNGPRPQKVRRL